MAIKRYILFAGVIFNPFRRFSGKNFGVNKNRPIDDWQL
ncbi:hypothetical protein CSC14_3388 [Proteus mirabilis]|nr:hypothetical protein BB2000_1877 [Proteus mirabilis BB2000]AWF39759.1 hypothetical protein CSC16_0744 [Proteus mirabilis]PVF83937.1 hypothetical protein CSC14_3388 [Proteus mirabilis]